MRWGLIPSWAKDPTIGFRTINARSETVTTTPSFREPFKSQRCLIPADGFYEWMKNGKEQATLLLRGRRWGDIRIRWAMGQMD